MEWPGRLGFALTFIGSIISIGSTLWLAAIVRYAGSGTTNAEVLSDVFTASYGASLGIAFAVLGLGLSQYELLRMRSSLLMREAVPEETWPRER